MENCIRAWVGFNIAPKGRFSPVKQPDEGFQEMPVNRRGCWEHTHVIMCMLDELNPIFKDYGRRERARSEENHALSNPFTRRGVVLQSGLRGVFSSNAPGPPGLGRGRERLQLVYRCKFFWNQQIYYLTVMMIHYIECKVVQSAISSDDVPLLKVFCFASFLSWFF